MASRGPISGAHDNIEQVDTNLCYNGLLRPAGPVDPRITYLCHCDHARLMAVTRFAAMVPTLVAWTAALGDFVLQQLNGQSQPQLRGKALVF